MLPRYEHTYHYSHDKQPKWDTTTALTLSLLHTCSWRVNCVQVWYPFHALAWNGYENTTNYTDYISDNQRQDWKTTNQKPVIDQLKRVEINVDSRIKYSWRKMEVSAQDTHGNKKA